MNDKDQHLIYEAYGQVNEASMNAVEALNAIRGAHAQGHEDLIPDIIEMTDNEALPDVVKKARMLGISHIAFNKYMPPLQGEEEYPLTPETPDPLMKAADQKANIHRWAEILTSRHLTKWKHNDYYSVVNVITALTKNKFKPKEAEHHYVEDGDEWLLGDTTEALEYAKVTFTTRAAYIEGQVESGEADFEWEDELPERNYLVAIFSANTTVDEADRYDLDKLEYVDKLIEAINEAGNSIN